MNEMILPFTLPSYIIYETETARFEGRFDNGAVMKRNVRVELVPQEDGTGAEIRIGSPDTGLRWVKLRFPTELFQGCRILGDAWERGYGDLEWRGISARRILPWYFLACSHSAMTYGIGVKVRPDALCFWEADPKGLTLFLDVRCGGEGVHLSGRTLHAATLIGVAYDGISPFEAGRAFCRAMCTDPHLPPNPVYGSNNWYYAYGKSSREEILKDTAYLSDLAQGFINRPYMVIDDGWQMHHRLNDYNGGPWRGGNAAFKDMGSLAGEMSEMGVIPGIWFRPLLNESTDLPASGRLAGGFLDPTVPETLSYIKEDVQTICGWGFRLIKHDFSTFDLFGRWGFEMNPLITKDGWHFQDRSVTSAEVVKLLYRVIFETAGQAEALVLGCNTIGHLGAGLMHLSRTGDDTSGREWERTRCMGINSLAFRLSHHGSFYSVDADCVGITSSIPWEYNRQWADLIARSGTALFVSVKPDSLDREQRRELSGSLKMASEGLHHATPLDWMESDCPQIWEDDGKVCRYDWYEKAGADFALDAKRFEPYLNSLY